MERAPPLRRLIESPHDCTAGKCEERFMDMDTQAFAFNPPPIDAMTLYKGEFLEYDAYPGAGD